MKDILIISGIFSLALLLNSCKETQTPSTVTTTAITDVSYTTATSGGIVTNEGGAPVASRGVCWNTSPNPTMNNSMTIDGGGLGAYISNVTKLTPNTKYYLRAYALNSAGTGYGNQLEFTSSPIPLATLTTTAISSITQTSAASGGYITNDNGESVIARGVCWGITPTPTTANNKTTDGIGIGSFVSSITGLQPGTIYYVRAYAANSVSISYGNEIVFTTTPTLPTLTTIGISSITYNTATSGGNVTSDGGTAITACGVCWNTTVNPTIANNKTTDMAGIGAFSSLITGLTLNTTYYVRAYAINSVGLAYGNEVPFTTKSGIIFNPNLTYGIVTDVDNNVYKTITIGTQTWMAENLKTTRYNDNAAIPLVIDNAAWLTSKPGYCWYNNDATTYKATFGALYNWYVIDSANNGGKNVCPTGWHVPTVVNWNTLVEYLTNNGYGFGGSGDDIAKSLAATICWTYKSLPSYIGFDLASNNSSGFTALPAGFRTSAFQSIGDEAIWWHVGEMNLSEGCFIGMGEMYLYTYKNCRGKYWGLSIRCLKNN